MAEIYNEKSNTLLSGTSGNDKITNSGSNVTVRTYDGDDNIITEWNRNNVSINAGAGNDSIYNNGFNATIIGGKGNDTINSGAGRDNFNGAGMVYVYNSGDGNDLILGFGVLETLVVEGSTYSTVKSGNDILVKVGKDTITLSGASELINVNIVTSTKGIVPVNIVENETSNKTKTITGKSSSNWIRNIANNVTINGGADNDNIINYGNNDSINGGSGNDEIFHTNGYDVTILGGAGNDRISLSSYSENDVIQYFLGDGNDKIYGFKADSTLSIGGGSYSTKKSGSDVIVTVGDGKITLVGAAGLETINIKGTLTDGSSGKVSIPSDALKYNGHSYYIFNNKYTWEEAQAYCEARGGHLAVINDEAENNALFNYMKSKGYDSVYFGLSDAANEGTWKWATGDEVGYTNWNEASGEPNGGTYENYAMFYWKFTNGTWNDGDFSDAGTDNGGRAFICEWDTISKESNENSTLKTVTNSTKSPVTIASDVKNVDASKRTKAVKITGNDLANSIKGGSGNDKLYGMAGDDKLYGGKGNDSLSGGAGNDKLYGQDGNDSLVGGDGKDTLSGGVGNDKLYGNVGNDSLVGDDGKDTLSGGKGNDKLYGNAGNDSLLGGDGKDLLYGQAGDDKLYGQSGNDKLYGGSGKDSLWGGVGNDLLKGGKGNDWLKGGDGSDTFIYGDGDGKDIISGFENGDLLQITGTFTTSYNSSKKEIYFKVGSTAKAITLTDFTATTFHVNNDTYQLSGNKFVKK